MASREKHKEKSERRAEEIQKYINQHPECKIKGQKHLAITDDGKKEFDVYELPRYLLRLNQNNGRFMAEYSILREGRLKQGKNPDLDPDNKEDERVIRDILKGSHKKIDNKQRRDIHEELKQDFVANARNGGNGQRVPGTILYDGTYINGNRRDTVLEDLSRDPPDGCKPTQFQKIRVIRLPKEVTESEIQANEISEQISRDSREKYDYINTVLHIDRTYQNLINNDKLESEAAIKQIAGYAYGVPKSKIQEYIKFKKTADNFLSVINKRGQYHYIQSDDNGIVQMLIEIPDAVLKIKKLLTSPTKTSLTIQSLYMYALCGKTKPTYLNKTTGKRELLGYNHRGFRNFVKEVLHSEKSIDKLLESGTVAKVDWTKPQEYAPDFDSDIILAKNVTTMATAAMKPLTFLEEAATRISRVNKEMNGPNGREIRQQILKNGLDYIKTIQKDMGEISKKIKKRKEDN